MAGSVDRRAAERMAVTSSTACSFISPIVEDFGGATIRDISLNGIGMIVTKKVAIGSLLMVELVNEARNIAKAMMVRVAHVTPVNGGFLVGGEFTNPLTYQELTSFVM